MPNLPWILTISLAVGSGTINVLDFSWLWYPDGPGDLAMGDPPTLSAASGDEGEGDSEHQQKAYSGWAHLWGYSVLHYDVYSWIGPRWFSTPTQTGSLHTSGGWGLYVLDKLGLLICGEFWPWVAWSMLSMTLLGFSLASLYLLLMVCRPCLNACRCCCRQTRVVAREVGELLPELQPGGAYERLIIRGPFSSEGVDSEFFQRQVQGRGSERKPNDVVVLVKEQAARVRSDEQWARVDRHGLWVKIREVKGAATRSFRQQLEREGKIHLCRDQSCPLESMPAPGMHCKAYAVADANALVDLGAYAGWSTRRVVVLLACHQTCWPCLPKGCLLRVWVVSHQKAMAFQPSTSYYSGKVNENRVGWSRT